MKTLKMKTVKLFNLLSLTLLLTFFLTSCHEGLNLSSNCIKNNSENTETRSLDFEYFDAFDLNGSMDLEITEGNHFSVAAVGKPSVIDKLAEDSKVENETFVMDIDKCYKGDLTIKVTMPSLTKINIDGSGDVKTIGTFHNIKNLDLSVFGSGDMNLQLGENIVNMNSHISGSGDFDLSGSTNIHEITIKGSGDIKAFDLDSESTLIDITGSGDCKVSAFDLLDVKISGSGDVCYKGSPQVDQNISGSGDLRSCN